MIQEHPDVIKEMLAAYEMFWQETCSLMVNETATLSPIKPFQELCKKQLQAEGIPD
jgi:hypothetical protein